MARGTFQIRRAVPDDARRLLEIYRPIVTDTAISFELTPPDDAEFAARIAASLESHEWLVAEAAHGPCGYAYATRLRSRAAYARAVETSVYVDADHRGQGVATRLYQALFERLQARDFHNAFAGITLPNPASVALHESLGFTASGVFREVGFKFGRWHDVGWWQRPLTSAAPTSPSGAAVV